MKIEIGQKWVSEKHPWQDFEIYDGVVDTCVDAFKDESIPFDEQPETAKIFFWRRNNDSAFEGFIRKVKGEDAETTHPYAWYGEGKKTAIVSKIKKYKMRLK